MANAPRKVRKRGQDGRAPERKHGRLKCPPAFAPFRLAKIAFARIRPSALVVIEDFA
jgi:hypothetical protein